MASELRVRINCIKKHLGALFSKVARIIPDRSMKAIECWVIDQALYEAVRGR
jgi:hypothetical protein